MKMNYLIKTNARGDKRKKRITLIVVVVVFLSVIWASFFSGIFSSIGAWIWSGENSLSQSIRETAEFFKSKNTLLAENKELKDRLQTMTVDTLAVDITRQENKELKEILGRNENRSAVLASVLRTPPFSPYDTFVLDIGKDKDVQVGNYVFVGGTILVGEIVEVNPTSSKAQLFSSPGKISPVLVGTRSVSVEARGLGAGNFEIILPREIAIQKGDSIIMPDINSMLLGVVEEVDTDSAKTFQRVLFASPVNIQDVRWVTVVKSGSLR
ncbi:rod shape-determining protein MreC [Patescibacteria group bacterium]|nr:MAG: rod shape-determining protein MreC [Patescibacteria group bacterium]